ncbi:MAG: C2 family cysteine protease, partial [Microcoleus sp.]
MLKFYSDPIAAYNEISASIPPGQKFVQEGIDYEGYATKRIEDIYPGYPLSDGDAEIMGLKQGTKANCGVLTEIMAYTLSTRNDYTLEQGIYPYGLSSNGLYMIAVAKDYQRKWIAVDTLVPVNSSGYPIAASPASKDRGFWGMIFEKAFVTLMTGKYNTSNWIASFEGWYPRTRYEVSSFDDILKVFELGGHGNGGIWKIKDAAGVEKPLPPGLVGAHDYGVLDAFRLVDADGNKHELVLLCNPWGTSSADYRSSYADDSPFWDNHPEVLKYVQESRPDGGCFWMSWTELKSNQICSFSDRWYVPAPLSTHPHEQLVNYTFTDQTLTSGGSWAGRWPDPAQLRPVAIRNNDQMRITVNEPTSFRFTMRWLPGSTGDRHGYVAIATSGSNKP